MAPRVVALLTTRFHIKGAVMGMVVEPDWTEDEMARLMEMKWDGEEWIDIASALGRTKNACCQKYTQLRVRQQRITDERLSSVWFGKGSKGDAVYRAISAKFTRPPTEMGSLVGNATVLCTNVVEAEGT